MGGPQTARLLSAACLAGAGTMAIELSAVRLIAPWFGTSQAVWTSAIGAVLIALSVGYLLGGRWAAKDQPGRTLSIALWLAAAWSVGLPRLAPWVAEGLFPATASLEQVASALPLASLACSLVLFFPPALLLATAGPLVVELIVRATGCSAGAAGGRVLACSTLGSLFGTFGTTYLGIPLLGMSGTLWATAGCISCAAMLCSRAGRQHVTAVIVVGATLVASSGGHSADPECLAVEESLYQRVRVVQHSDGWRALEVNERRGSFQSVWAPEPGLLGPGYYYDIFALPHAWQAREAQWSLLVLGLGAGTTWRVVEGALPVGTDLLAAGVELDSTVVTLSHAHMGLPEGSERHRVIGGLDARAAVGPLSMELQRWNQIVIDVYANQVEIPPHLATLEFFRAVRGLLVNGGWLQLNVGASRWDDPLSLAIGATLAAAFGQPTLALEVPFSRNVILVQRLGLAPLDPAESAFLPEEDNMQLLAQRLRLPGTWGWVGSADGRHLVDGDAPLEALQRASLRSLEDAP